MENVCHNDEIQRGPRVDGAGLALGAEALRRVLQGSPKFCNFSLEMTIRNFREIHTTKVSDFCMITLKILLSVQYT